VKWAIGERVPLIEANCRRCGTRQCWSAHWFFLYCPYGSAAGHC